MTAYVLDPWNPRSTISNDVVLDFTDGELANRWLFTDQVDEPIAFERYAGTTDVGSGTAFEIFSDRLGSPISVVESATGTEVAGYSYDSFGARTASGSLTQRYGFTGREVYAESGLMYLRARAYDPALGQFLQRDPIGFEAGDLNLYAYTWNDPHNWTDPSGLEGGEYAVLAGGAGGFGLAVGDVTAGALSLGMNIRNALIAMTVLSVSGDSADEDDGERPGPGHNGPPDKDGDDSASKENPWDDVIDGVREHPDGPAKGGRKPQGIKEGGQEQAEQDFKGATDGRPVWEIDGGWRDTGPNGENVIYRPEAGSGDPTIYVDGGAVRYP